MTIVSPLRGRIAVRPDEKETTSSGGIIIPDVSQKETTTGVVVAKAPDVKGVQVGDKVLYIKFAGEKTMIDGLLILDFDSEVLAVIEKEGD